MTEPPRTVFAAIDHAPAPMQALLLGALARMAESPQIRAVRAVAGDALAPRPGLRLLDAGCGLGEAARELAPRVAPGGEVVAADASSVTVAAAAERHDGSAVRYQVADVLALPFDDGAFDGVRCERVLQHLAEPDAAIRELARVTRPGGRVVLVDTDWESVAVDGLPEDLVAAVRDKLASRDLLHHQSMGRTLRRRALRAGLADVTCVPVPLVFTSDAAPSLVLPMFSRDVPPEADMVPSDLRERWFDAVDDATARDELLVVLTMWVVAGTPA
jgi:SAM-dependent methyltransferase